MKAFSALKGHYVKIPNELLNDPNISWKAKGLFCHMASKPDNFNFTIRSLSRQVPDGIKSIYSALTELKNRGWINYIKSGDGTGKYSLDTTLNPVATPDTDNGIQAEPNTGNGNKGADPNTDNGIKGGEPNTGNGNKGADPNTQKPNQGFGCLPKSARINKKDLNNNKDVCKGAHTKGEVLLESKDGDPFGSSTRYTTEEILDMLAKGVIDVH